jgi:hypothetical protein
MASYYTAFDRETNSVGFAKAKHKHSVLY